MLKELREKKGLTQVYVAKRLHISACRLSMYESGTRKLPLQFILPLSEIYEVSVEQLLECLMDKVS